MKYFMALIIGLAVGVAFAAIGAWFTALFVNYLFSAALLTFVFGSAKIGFWQAFVLNILVNLLFRSSTTVRSDD